MEGQARRLRGLLQAADLRSVRKAHTPFLALIVALEILLADPSSQPNLTCSDMFFSLGLNC